MITLDVLDMQDVSPDEAYAYGYDAADAADVLRQDEVLRLVREW